MHKHLHLCRGIAEVSVLKNQRFVFQFAGADPELLRQAEQERTKPKPEKLKDGDAEAAAKKRAEAVTGGAAKILESFEGPIKEYRATITKALIDSVDDPKAKQAIAAAMEHSGKDSMNALNANVAAAIRNIDTAGFEKLYKHPLLVSVIEGASIQEIAQKKKAVDKVMSFGKNAEHFEKTVQQEARLRRAGGKPEAYLALYVANPDLARAKIIHSASINKDLAVDGMYALNQINAAKGDTAKILDALVQYESVRLAYAQKLGTKPAAAPPAVANHEGGGRGAGPGRLAMDTAEAHGKLYPSTTGAETSRRMPPGTPVVRLPEAAAGGKKSPEKAAKASSSPAKKPATKPAAKAPEVSGERLDKVKLVPGSRLVVKYDVASRDASGKSLNHPQRAGTELIVVDPADKTMTGYDKKQHNYIKVKAPGAGDDKAFYVARDWLRVKDAKPAAAPAVKKKMPEQLAAGPLPKEENPAKGMRQPLEKPKEPAADAAEKLGHAVEMQKAKVGDVVSATQEFEVRSGDRIIHTIEEDTPVLIEGVQEKNGEKYFQIRTPEGKRALMPSSALGTVPGITEWRDSRDQFVKRRYAAELKQYNDYTLRKGAREVMIVEDAKREQPQGKEAYAKATKKAELKLGAKIVRPDPVLKELFLVGNATKEPVALLARAGSEYYKVATNSGIMGYVHFEDVKKQLLAGTDDLREEIGKPLKKA